LLQSMSYIDYERRDRLSLGTQVTVLVQYRKR
jgi:hypothetical protein